MSATDLIEKVKSLPAREQMLFTEWFRQWKSRDNGGDSKPAIFQMPDYEGRLKQLFPNGPIDGDPQQFWDELRADRF
jgi:hypothetical protein